jgi:hypothetical protein
MRAQVVVDGLGVFGMQTADGYVMVMVRPSFNGQVQAARLPTPTSPDNPFKPETSNVSPGSSVESILVISWDYYHYILFIVPSTLETFLPASLSTSVGWE